MLTIGFYLPPLFSGCPRIYDYYTISYVIECDHVLTYTFDTYNGLIPVFCMFLNIGLIFYMSFKRRKLHKATDPISIARRSHEKTMVIQSILSTAFLLTYEIGDTITDLYSIALLVLLVIPNFSGCAVNYSFYTFDYSTACDPDVHFITYIFDTYTGLIPLFCLISNFALIFYISQRRKRIENPKDRKLNARQSHEKTLLIQSISSTTFLLTYEITGFVTDIFSEEYESLPAFTRRIIYYGRAGSVAFTCFFIYFIGTPSIRKIVTAKVMKMVTRKKRKPRIVLSSRDVSTMF
uniref:7TM_GPCR_Srx domain-containing protein n=1 Tax=Caenorhabditis tropicalis TaxID=1561998 RepID=A0A1I7V3Z5_9PELO